MDHLKLSKLAEQVNETLQAKLENKEFWISAQITAIKKYDSYKRCYLTLGEYENGAKVAEMKAVFWHTTYDEIAKFEKITGQQFKDGIEVVCRVMVRFNKVYGLNLEIFEISAEHTIGSIELQKKQTVDKLMSEGHVTVIDGAYKTKNNQTQLPVIIKNIALITAPNSDGQRDFIQEISKNPHGYTFLIKEFATTIQGDNAHSLIADQLKAIEKLISEKNGFFDVVAIVRGGGAQSDFKPFDNYDLAKYIANFPIPVFTGIGHDRNQSIVDLMAREQKTPTKVASVLVQHNFSAESKFTEQYTKFFNTVARRLQKAKDKVEAYKPHVLKLASTVIKTQENKLSVLKASTFKAVNNNIRHGVSMLSNYRLNIIRMADSRLKSDIGRLNVIKQTVKLSDPQSILNRGFALVTFNGKIVTDSTDVEGGVEIQARLKNGTIYSTVIKKN